MGIPDNGVGVSLYPTKPTYAVNYEWTTVETVLIRFDTYWTPNGSFPVYSERQDGHMILGYDAAVCVQKYEPWIIEVYNTSFASPSILRIVEKWNGSFSSPPGRLRGPLIADIERHLDDTPGKWAAFGAAHDNGVQMLKATGEDSGYYIPSPTVGSIVPACATFLLNSTHSTGRFFHQWH